MEFKQLDCLGVSNTPILLPEGASVVNTRLIFKEKRTADGEIKHYKARIVAQDFLHMFSVHVFATYPPVVRLT